LAEKEVNVTHGLIRMWCIKFGPRYARMSRGKSSLISWKVTVLHTENLSSAHWILTSM